MDVYALAEAARRGGAEAAIAAKAAEVARGFYPPNRVGAVAFKAHRDGGMLLFFMPKAIQLFANYPSAPPWAAEKKDGRQAFVRWRRNLASSGPRPFEFGQLVRVLDAHHARERGEHVRGRAAAVSTIKAYERFAALCDPDHLREVARFNHHSFRLYNSVRRCPGLFDLLIEPGETPELAGPGALAYALAHYHVLHTPVPTHPLRAVRSLLKRKRREIAIALGFPRERAAVAVRLLGRIPRADITPITIHTLHDAVQRADAPRMKLMMHATRINEEAAHVLCADVPGPWLTPILLEEIGRDNGTPNEWRWIRRLAEDTAGMLGCRGVQLPPIRSIAELQSIHDAEIVRANAARRARGPRRCVFSEDPSAVPRVRTARQLAPAPVPDVVGRIEYLATQEALSAEGEAMHNCVSGYARRVESGRCFIYRVLEPERCTLSIALDRSDHFSIEQLCGPCNAKPRLQDTYQAVESWLRDNHDESAVARTRELRERLGESNGYSERAQNRGMQDEAECPC